MDLPLGHQLEKLIRQIAKEELCIQLAVIRDVNAPLPSSFTPTISSQFGWTRQHGTLLRLHEVLLNRGWHSCDQDLFIQHFKSTQQPTNYICWKTHIYRLVYLFSRLNDLGFIPQTRNIHSILTDHFVDKKQKELGNDSLRSSLNAIRNEKVRDIDDIIDELEKIDKRLTSNSGK